MAESGINFMAMLNPQFAAQQQKFALQQQMAQQMMQQGSEEPPTAQLANPGGQVVQNSPWAALSRAVEKGTGAYISNKAIGDQMAAYQNMGSGSGVMGASGDPLMPTQQELMVGQLSPEQGKAMYEARTAGIKAKLQAQGDTVTDANGRIIPKSNIVGQPDLRGSPSIPAVNTGQPKPDVSTPFPAPMSPDKAAQIDSLYGAGAEKPSTQPVVLKGASDEPANIPMAADGKPLFSNLTKPIPPDPTGNPTWDPATTNTDVNQIKLNQEDLQKGNAGFASAAQTLQQQKAILSNLTDIYKGTQSGTLTMQHPEWINKLVGVGVITDPSTIHSVADAQAAINNHILGAIGQIKDANANMDGNPTRTFGAEINAILEKGQNQTNQPEALWKTIGEANGLIDHHLDLINSWQNQGASGNKLNAGTTMLPNQFVQKFNADHPIDGYTAKAYQNLPTFKGMAGNNSPSAQTKTVNGITYQKINGVWHQ